MVEKIPNEPETEQDEKKQNEKKTSSFLLAGALQCAVFQLFQS